MGLFKKENLSILQETTETQSAPAENASEAIQNGERLSLSEDGARIRHMAAEKVQDATRNLGDLGSRIWSGMKRIGAKTVDTTLGAAAQGYGAIEEGFEQGMNAAYDARDAAGEKFQVGMSALYETPDWLMDKAGQGLENIGTGADAVIGAGARGLEWTGRKASEKYASLETYATEKIEHIKDRAGQAREKFNASVRRAVEWKNNTMSAIQEWRLTRALSKVESLLGEIPEGGAAKEKVFEIRGLVGLSESLREQTA